ALGWESEGITLEKARLELAKLREARRTGKGPRSLAEKRELAENKRKAEEEARRREALANISLKDFWDKHYWPAQKHKAEDSLVAEESLFKKWIRSAFTFNISLAALRKKWWKSGGKITERREMAYGVFCNIMIFLVELDKIELTAS
ncbi:MAG: hypothetical protein FWG59_04730, partial [Betaproteobacteria bacterium]|nr:hypothetical protein [Betaproteobacteria bacterium]